VSGDEHSHGKSKADKQELDDILHHHSSDEILDLVDVNERFFSCIDARNENSVVGAFGGDFGEFLIALDVYRTECTARQSLTDEHIELILRDFVVGNTTPQRPFYLHTDDARLKSLLDAMDADTFPSGEDLTMKSKKKWLDALLQTEIRYHGCGHVWNVLANAEEYGTDVNMVKGTLKAFHELYWNPKYSNRILYGVMSGTYNARAVMEINTRTNNNLRGGGVCDNQVVPMRPRFCAHGCPARSVREFSKSKQYELSPEYDVFTFHKSAVEHRRERVIAPFFKKRCKGRVTEREFAELVTERAERWSQLTLKHLKALPSDIPHIQLDLELEPVS
jgi:hypothetical protein